MRSLGAFSVRLTPDLGVLAGVCFVVGVFILAELIGDTAGSSYNYDHKLKENRKLEIR